MRWGFLHSFVSATPVIQPLSEQELIEANTWLLRFLRLEHNYMMLLGVLLICGPISLSVLAIQMWRTGEGSSFRLALATIALVVVGVAAVILRQAHLKRVFGEIQARALKLQRAGFVLYKKPVFLKNILGASEGGLPKDVSSIDFETLSPNELHHIFS